MGEDLAERVDDLICAWDKVVGTELETVVILLLGEILVTVIFQTNTPPNRSIHFLASYHSRRAP